MLGCPDVELALSDSLAIKSVDEAYMAKMAQNLPFPSDSQHLIRPRHIVLSKRRWSGRFAGIEMLRLAATHDDMGTR